VNLIESRVQGAQVRSAHFILTTGVLVIRDVAIVGIAHMRF
jgi:hypothetical protein